MNIEKLVRKNILRLKPYTAARHSHNKGILLDANENSYGSVTDENYAELNRYPDPYQKVIRDAMGNYSGVNPDNLFFGVGSDEIIDLLIRIFCEPGKDNVIVTEPTYGMYGVACEINDIEVKNVPLNSKYDIESKAILNSVDANTKIIFLCSPNNPTANLLNSNSLLDIVNNSGSIVVIDEAYIEFSNSEGLFKAAASFSNLVVLRTFSKAWGLAGLRCGYCSASKEIIDLLFKVKSPYNINKITSEMILNALSNSNKKDQYVSEIIDQREILISELKKRTGILSVLHSDSNFISFKVHEPKKVFSYLEKNGIIIRDRSNQYNFDGFLRVTVGTQKENDLFLKKLHEVL